MEKIFLRYCHTNSENNILLRLLTLDSLTKYEYDSPVIKRLYILTFNSWLIFLNFNIKRGILIDKRKEQEIGS